jgi:hypothetical protein
MSNRKYYKVIPENAGSATARRLIYNIRLSVRTGQFPLQLIARDLWVGGRVLGVHCPDTYTDARALLARLI